eukprot:3276587-Prymnesium_polylepis.1
MRDTLQGGFYGGVAGFSIEDIAVDCLHPESGRLGTEHTSDVLIHLPQKAARWHARAAAGAVKHSSLLDLQWRAEAFQPRSAHAALPAPLFQ